ncbi:unnamed protein product [Cunninghamella echinulata]
MACPCKEKDTQKCTCQDTGACKCDDSCTCAHCKAQHSNDCPCTATKEGCQCGATCKCGQ